jgi:hypothetical protein
MCNPVLLGRLPACAFWFPACFPPSSSLPPFASTSLCDTSFVIPVHALVRAWIASLLLHCRCSSAVVVFVEYPSLLFLVPLKQVPGRTGSIGNVCQFHEHVLLQAERQRVESKYQNGYKARVNRNHSNGNKTSFSVVQQDHISIFHGVLTNHTIIILVHPSCTMIMEVLLVALLFLTVLEARSSRTRPLQQLVMWQGRMSAACHAGKGDAWN